MNRQSVLSFDDNDGILFNKHFAVHSIYSSGDGSTAASSTQSELKKLRHAKKGAPRYSSDSENSESAPTTSGVHSIDPFSPGPFSPGPPVLEKEAPVLEKEAPIT